MPKIFKFGWMKGLIHPGIRLYSSALITGILTLPRLLSLQEKSIWAAVVPFDVYEWLTQGTICFLYCYASLGYNVQHYKFFPLWRKRKPDMKWIVGNLFILALFMSIGGLCNLFFSEKNAFVLNGYLIRLVLAGSLVIIVSRLVALTSRARREELEKERLLRENMNMELELLRAQVNPHFLFNTLSSLSGIVRENPSRAQHYIFLLSKVFRYTLNNNNPNGLLTLKEELEKTSPYSELLKLRYENGYNFEVCIKEKDLLRKLPSFSLQPLIENAVKHNLASEERPLKIELFMEDDKLVVRNNYQPRLFAENGFGIGLHNLNKRFMLFIGNEIEIIKTNRYFLVKLPCYA